MINSVLKAIDILQAFSPSEPRLTLAEIAGRLGMPKSTTHNLLATLLSCGFVEKVDADRYTLGTAVVALTQAVRVNVKLRNRATPLLRDLADQCRESVYLTVLDGDYGLYIYAVESPNRLMARTAVGDRAHLHCTSVGKAMLAYLPEAEVEAIVARVGLPASSARTIARLDDLRGGVGGNSGAGLRHRQAGARAAHLLHRRTDLRCERPRYRRVQHLRRRSGDPGPPAAGAIAASA